MKRREAGPVPWGLRVLHALVFLTAAAGPLMAGSTEWGWLARSLERPFTPGTPAQWGVLAGSGASGVLGLLMLLQLIQRRSIRLSLSLGVIGALALTVLGLSGPLPEGRSWASADGAILRSATALQREAVAVLQREGEAPSDARAWSALLQTLPAAVVPVHRGASRRSLSYEVLRVNTPSERPLALVPGMLLVFVSPDRASFIMRVVGLDATSAAVILSDDRGDTLLLRGTFNPENANREPSHRPLHETPPSGGGL